MSILDAIRSFDSNYSPIQTVAGIFPRGFLSFIASRPGLGKTLLIQKFVCDCSLKDYPVWEGIGYIDKPLKSLYIVGETGTDLLIERVRKANWKFNPEYVKLISLADAKKVNEDISLTDPEGKKNMFKLLNEFQPDIVVFDSVISFHECDESDQGSITKIYKSMSNIASFWNAAVIGIHHVRKRHVRDATTRIDQDELIGSSSAVRLAAFVMLLAEKIDPETNAMTNEAHCVKSWDEKLPPFGYKISSGVTYLKLSFTPYIYYERTLAYRVKRYIKQLKPQEQFTPSKMLKVIGAKSTSDVSKYLSALQEEEVIQFVSKDHITGEPLFTGVQPGVGKTTDA